MSDSTQPMGGDSTGGAAPDTSSRKRPSLAPMASSVTNAPMKTRPPMTPLPPLAPRPPSPPEPVEAPVKKSKKSGQIGLLFVVFLAVAGAAYYFFLR